MREPRIDHTHCRAFAASALHYARNYARGSCVDWDIARRHVANMSEAACYIADAVRYHGPGSVKAVVLVWHGGRSDGQAQRYAGALIRFLNAFKDAPPADRYEALVAIQVLDDAAARMSEMALHGAPGRLSVDCRIVNLETMEQELSHRPRA